MERIDANITGAGGRVNPNGVGALSFTPVLVPNVVFLVLFIALFVCQIALTVKFWRFYGYAIGMLGGLLLELLGYAAKVQLSKNRMDKNGYIMYIIGLTLGPTFLSSSLYLGISTLQRNYHAAKFRRIKPHIFATLFILGDFLCLCFIGCGGSLAAIFAESPIGVDLMIAGLAVQVLFTAIFCLLLYLVYRKIYWELKQYGRHWYMIVAAVAATCLFIRSCWRVAELNGGFNGPLSSKEELFIALDSVPIFIMSTLLTVFHPGFWFPQKRQLPLYKQRQASRARQWTGHVKV